MIGWPCAREGENSGQAVAATTCDGQILRRASPGGSHMRGPLQRAHWSWNAGSGQMRRARARCDAAHLARPSPATAGEGSAREPSALRQRAEAQAGDLPGVVALDDDQRRAEAATCVASLIGRPLRLFADQDGGLVVAPLGNVFPGERLVLQIT